MKKLLCAFVLFALISSVYSQEEMLVSYCASSVQSISPDDFDLLGINELNISSEEGCECFNFQGGGVTAWNDLYCDGTEEGGLVQQRVVSKPADAECNSVIQVTEQRTIQSNVCKMCPAPESLSRPESVGCLGQKEVFRTDVKAFKFDVSVDSCKKVDAQLFEVRNSGFCENPISQNFVGLSNYWWVSIPVAGGLGFLLLRRRKSK